MWIRFGTAPSVFDHGLPYTTGGFPLGEGRGRRSRTMGASGMCEPKDVEAPCGPERRAIRGTNTGEDRMPIERKAKPNSEERPVIVTTAHRGVFFGYADDTDGETITLKRSRLCLYWSRDVKGFMGLASGGPTAGCRIGPAADITLRNITAVIEVSPEAVKAWEAAPWAA